MNILGLDPSLTATGWAVGNQTGTIHGADGDDRLDHIYQTVRTLSDVVDYAIVEDLPTHGMGAGKTGMVQGVVRLALLHNLVSYRLITAATLKKFATGKGNATKSDMRMALYQRTGVDLADDNQVDAGWLRYLGYALVGELPFALPRTHLTALDKIPALEGTPAA